MDILHILLDILLKPPQPFIGLFLLLELKTCALRDLCFTLILPHRDKKQKCKWSFHWFKIIKKEIHLDTETFLFIQLPSVSEVFSNEVNNTMEIQSSVLNLYFTRQCNLFV